MNEQLDRVLQILSERDKAHVNLPYEIETKYYELYPTKADFGININEILDKLVDDGYVSVSLFNNNTERGYSIKHEGRAFLMDGGYLNSRKSLYQYYLRLSILERLLGFAALMTGIYYLVHLLKGT